MTLDFIRNRNLQNRREYVKRAIETLLEFTRETGIMFKGVTTHDNISR